MKRFSRSVVGLAASAVILAPVAVAAQVPDPLPDESITELAVATPELSTLVTALTAAELADGLGDCTADPVTVFAPTDAAFGALDPVVLAAALEDPSGLLTGVLTYHVVPGIVPASDVTAATTLTTAQGEDISVEGTVLNGSINITATDTFACNGVIHLIDGVLLPPSVEAFPSITDLAAGSDDLSTLVTAVTAAGLADGLADCTADPVTVFAPTNAAFAALDAATLEAALADPDGLLTTVLTYHVVPGIVSASQATAATSLTTAQGETISVDGTVLNGSINITATNNFACNGVVHLIDGVLLPPSLTAAPDTGDELPETGSQNGQMIALASVLILLGLAMTSVRRRGVA